VSGAGRIIERWPVTQEEVVLSFAAKQMAATIRGDSVEREIAAAGAAEVDPDPVPEPSDKAAELDQVRELLKAAGFVSVDNFSRQGAPGSGVRYIELRSPSGQEVLLRTRFLFNKPVSWKVTESWICDLEELREVLS
jgi:hypothetical protein